MNLLYPKESYLIRGACFAIYKKFRNTQKESVYQKSLLEELKNRGLVVDREKQLPVYHLGVKVGIYTPDLLVNNVIISILQLHLLLLILLWLLQLFFLLTAIIASFG